MARQGFQNFHALRLTRNERSTYVMLASLTLILLVWQWQPMPSVVWNMENPLVPASRRAGGFLGWLIVLYSTFLISPFRVVRMTQVVTHFAGRVAEPMKFRRRACIDDPHRSISASSLLLVYADMTWAICCSPR